MRPLTLLITLMLAFAGLPASAEIYKTKGKDGQTIYTDVPPGKSNPKPVTLPPINSLPAPPLPVGPSYSRSVREETIDYQLEIISPADGDLFTPDKRELPISVRLIPGLGQGLLLNYQMDGVSLQKTTETSVVIAEPFRGERTLVVTLENEEGDVLTQSQPVRVVIIRPTIKQKPKTVPPKGTPAPK